MSGRSHRGPLRRAWGRLWDRAPRQLSFTREGRVLVGIAFATGFAALNTGNNLLYLGWGMVLSAIVLSGVLSEATLRVLAAHPASPNEGRALEPAAVPLFLANRSMHLPSYAVQLEARVRGPGGEVSAPAPFQMRVQPARDAQLHCRFTPTRRGRHVIVRLVLTTAYPFGFFEKSRRVDLDVPAVFWIYPARVDVAHLVAALTARLGESPAGRAGFGDDFFSLRPHRHGDDPRRVHWRRSARTGRWVVVETEAARGQEVQLDLSLARPTASREQSNERAICVAGSLAEELLARGFRVGLRGPGISVPADGGLAGRRAVLAALARLDPHARVVEGVGAMPLARIGLVAAGAPVPPGAASVFHIDDVAPPTEGARVPAGQDPPTRAAAQSVP